MVFDWKGEGRKIQESTNNSGCHFDDSEKKRLADYYARRNAVLVNRMEYDRPMRPDLVLIIFENIPSEGNLPSLSATGNYRCQKFTEAHYTVVHRTQNSRPGLTVNAVLLPLFKTELRRLHRRQWRRKMTFAGRKTKVGRCPVDSSPWHELES